MQINKARIKFQIPNSKFNIIKLLQVSIIGFALVFAFSTQTQAARYIFNPSTATFVEGCDKTAVLQIDTEGASTNAADVLVKYDPTKVTILDSDPITAGVQIKVGNMYQAYFGNIVDSGLGEIRLTGASFSSSFTGIGTFAIIEFKALPGTTNSIFTVYTTGYGPFVSLDSNIADTLTSNDLLTGVVNANYSFTTGFCVADIQAPGINYSTPTSGQTGVPSSANLSINITDNQSGTNINTVEVVINGVTQNSLSSGFTYTGALLNYNLVITPTNPLNTSSANVVLVRATDFAGNVRTSSIIFNVPTPPPPPPTPVDNDSPIITFVAPIDKAIHPLNNDLLFDVADTGFGIEITSLNVILNGKTYPASATQITYNGTLPLYHVTLNPEVDLPNDTSFLVVYIEDKAGNGAIKSIAFNIKVIDPGPPVTPTPSPSIVPIVPITCPVNSTQVVTQVVTQTGQPFIIALNPILGTTNQDVLQTVSSVSPFASILANLLLFGTQLWQLPYLLFQWGLGLLSWFGLRTKGRPYGYVYDSVSKEPLSLAIVRFFTTTGKLVHTDVTDVYGVFTGRLKKGTYYITVARPDYKFPSVVVPGIVDYPYDQIYHGERFNVDENEEVTLSIPLDAAKVGLVNSKIESFKGLLSLSVRYITPLLMALGVGFSAYLLFKFPSVINFAILLLYVPTIYFYVRSLRENSTKYGTVKTVDGMLLKNLEIGLVNTEFDKIVAKRISDDHGYYRFVVEPGEYKLQVLNQDFAFATQPKTYHQEFGTDKNEPLIIADNLFVSRKVQTGSLI